MSTTFKIQMTKKSCKVDIIIIRTNFVTLNKTHEITNKKQQTLFF